MLNKNIGRKPKNYALYKGDKFLELGTIKEIAEKVGCCESLLYKIRTTGYKSNYDLDLIEED